MNNSAYDVTDPKSIEGYAIQLENKTFLEILEEKGISDKSVIAAYANAARKGGLGNLLEEVYFGYKANSKQEADFEEAGVELKATPYEITKNGEKRAGERLVLTMINYDKPVEIDFYKSHAWKKMRLILLIYYLRDKQLQSNLLYKISYAKLFTPPESDLEIIKQDYKHIITMIQAGKAHELSEGDTLYLGACTKGSNAEKSTVPQYYGDKTPARKRAFCFKNSYMTYVLRNYIASKSTICKHGFLFSDSEEPNHYGISASERIIPDVSIFRITTFEDFVVRKIEIFRGRDIASICEEFELRPRLAYSVVGKEIPPKALSYKHLTATVAYRILGIKGNKAEEFIKAGIQVKTIRLNKNGNLVESMSFPTFKFKEIASEEWEDDAFREYLRVTKFFFVVYQYDENDCLRLKGCQFWNMPISTIETDVRAVWQRTHDVLNEGMKITIKNGKSFNNLPGMTFNPVCHVRPHAQNKLDTDTLPDGREYPKQCFWLTNKYILSQLDDKLKT